MGNTCYKNTKASKQKIEFQKRNILRSSQGKPKSEEKEALLNAPQTKFEGQEAHLNASELCQ